MEVYHRHKIMLNGTSNWQYLCIFGADYQETGT
jgi:hypothetical protein